MSSPKFCSTFLSISGKKWKKMKLPNFFLVSRQFQEYQKVFAKILQRISVISRRRSIRISKKFGHSRTKHFGALPWQRNLVRRAYSDGSTEYIYSCICGLWTFWQVESQTVQLYNQVGYKPSKCPSHPNLHIYKRKLKLNYFLSLVAYKDQRWSPWGHILKSLASKVKSLASRPQVLENWPVPGSRTALFFE